MYEWIVVVLVGLIGGLGNSYLTVGGFSPPTWITDQHGKPMWDPGAIGYIGIGGIAAFVMWALNTPSTSMSSTDVRPFALAGALIAGTGGSRVLSGLVDRVIAETNSHRTSRALQQATSATRAIGALHGAPVER